MLPVIEFTCALRTHSRPGTSWMSWAIVVCARVRHSA
jgi:hypothetical protein